MVLFVSWLIKQISMGITVILGGRVQRMVRREEEGREENQALFCARAKLSLWEFQTEHSVPPALDLCHSH